MRTNSAGSSTIHTPAPAHPSDTSARGAIPRWSAERAMAAPVPSPARRTARTVANEYTEFSWTSANARDASASSASVIAPEAAARISVSRDGRRVWTCFDGRSRAGSGTTGSLAIE